MICRVYRLYCLALAFTLMIAGGVMCAKTIVIQVSDEIDLKDTDTKTVSGQTCMPVRAIAEAMGAKVEWDVRAGVLTVTGSSGVARLRLGDTSATVNGTKVSFPVAPFVHGGRFYAPLGFFHRFFNMGLIWDPYRQAYRWVPVLPPPTYPTPPVIYGPGSAGTDGPAGQPRRTVAEVIRVRPSATGTAITVSVGNREVTYRVAGDATVLRGRLGGRSTEVPVTEIRPGDRVSLQIDETGIVTSIRAQYQEVRGTVRSIQAERIVLDTGRTLRITEDTRFVLPGNARGQLRDLSVGDQVIAGISPISGSAYLISVQAVQGRDQPNLLLSSYGPLSTGDMLRVTFRASAGGRALLTIPGLLTSAPMAETSPGIYEATYTVRAGDELLGLPIQVTFVRPDGAEYQTLSQRPVTITTESGYLPRIISPRNGQIIGSPITITGIANAGSLVQVSVEFRRDIQGVMPIEGLSDIQLVRAGADGVWKTEPMAATAPFHDLATDWQFDFGILEPLYEWHEYPTVFAITALEIGPDGRPAASYAIETLRGRGVEVGL